MTATQFSLLPAAASPLLDKFYRAHKSPMRASNEAQLWVAKQAEIVGALCLTTVADGHWLTGVFVAPSLRGQAIASRLLDQALAPLQGPVWLFCHPDLLSLYQRAGFANTADLPEPLADRFERYCRSKTLIALSRPAIQA